MCSFLCDTDGNILCGDARCSVVFERPIASLAGATLFDLIPPIAVSYMKSLFWDQLLTDGQELQPEQFRFTYPLELHESSFQNASVAVLTSQF